MSRPRSVLVVSELQADIVRRALKDWVEEGGRSQGEQRLARSIFKQLDGGAHSDPEQLAIVRTALLYSAPLAPVEGEP